MDPTGPEVIGHAALALARTGGTPTRMHLDKAIASGTHRVEVDLCCSADGQLVLRHDTVLGDGRYVGDLELGTLRREDPFLLTLDEAVETVAGRVPLLLDLKMPAAAQALGRWAKRRRGLDAFAVCTENLPLILHLRFAAPRLARWPSFPDLGNRRSHHVRLVLHNLWRTHASRHGLRSGWKDLQTVARHLRSRPHEALAGIGGLPWRTRLPLELEMHCDELAAAGICVQKWLVSPELVGEAHRAGLHVNTWTVNSTDTARTLQAAGVDSITTDRVAAIRLALGHGAPARTPTTPRRQRRPRPISARG